MSASLMFLTFVGMKWEEKVSRACGRLTPSRSKRSPSTERKRNHVRIFVASGHAPPPFEPADAPFYGVARLVPFRVVRLEVQASVPGRKDGCDVPLREPGAEGVAAIGPVRDQAGQGRAGSGFPQGPGLDTVVALAAGHAQRLGTALSIRQDMARGAAVAPVATQRVIRRGLLGRARPAHVRARPCCLAARRTDPDWPAGRPSGAARHPDRTHGRSSGDRPSSTSRTRPATAAKRHPTAPSSTARSQKGASAFHHLCIYRNRSAEKIECGAIEYRSSGAVLRAMGSADRTGRG